MELFEGTLVLLLVAVLLLRGARRLGLPYPSLLALAGAAAAALPWAPSIHLEPHLALALFVAPALLDSAYDLPPRELRRHWLALIALALLAVVLTTAVVAVAGHALAGLPWPAAVALGAIVAPSDAVAATTVLQRFQLPRRTLAILQGESLLNDAVALLLFDGALRFAREPDATTTAMLGQFALAVPGAVLFGILAGALTLRLMALVAQTHAGTVLQFVCTFGVWLLAAHLQLSPILAIVAYAMVLAREAPQRTRARDRVQAWAVWDVVVFVLNVLAFLLMGLQARVIVGDLSAAQLGDALRFALVVVALVVLVRLGWVTAFAAAMRRLGVSGTPGWRNTLVVAWCGLRGLVTLATAFALPQAFPGRPLIVLTAFAVVLATLVGQGLSIAPLIRALRIRPDPVSARELEGMRAALLDAALAVLRAQHGKAADAVRHEYALARAEAGAAPHGEHDRLRLTAIAAQRARLEGARRAGDIGDDTYQRLQRELDWAELSATPEHRLDMREA